MDSKQELSQSHSVSVRVSDNSFTPVVLNQLIPFKMFSFFGFLITPQIPFGGGGFLGGLGGGFQART